MESNNRILVADDDLVTRKLLAATLERAGYQVDTAQDGLDAVEKASTLNPSLVLLDGLLPKMHGFQACKIIKELPLPPKVILLTGVYTKPTYKYEVMREYGADAFLRKPFKPAEVLECIEKHLKAAAVENQVPADALDEPISASLTH